jgi:hypothetical protein
MKKPIILLLVLTVAAFFPASAQISVPADSIPSTLCKTWTVSYALMGDTRIDMKPGAQAMDFDFKKDKTLMVSAGPTDPKTKGTWVYDATSKTVKLTINGQSRGTVTKLQADQLIISMDTKDAAPDDPMVIKLVYKVKGS